MFFGGYLGGKPPKHGNNVIEIDQHVSQNRFPELAEVDAYWTALKGSRQMPARLELDPRGIEGALAHAFMLERIAPGVARIRLAGSHLNDLMGMEIRGMPVSALIAPEDRSVFSASLEQVFQGPTRLVADMSAERGLGKPRFDGRMLILPLTDEKNQVTRALGCLSTAGQIGRSPRRFQITAQRAHPLSGTVPLPRTAIRSNSFAEDARPFAPKIRPQRQKPVLRVVKTDE